MIVSSVVDDLNVAIAVIIVDDDDDDGGQVDVDFIDFLSVDAVFVAVGGCVDVQRTTTKNRKVLKVKFF